MYVVCIYFHRPSLWGVGVEKGQKFKINGWKSNFILHDESFYKQFYMVKIEII